MIFPIKPSATISLALALVVLCGCGGNVDRSCDEVRVYQRAAEGKRIDVPEDLDSLDQLKEIPLPAISPRPPRPAGSRCLDMPPVILGDK